MMDRILVHAMANAIRSEITGFTLEDCYSLSKQEWVLVFHQKHQWFRIRLQLNGRYDAWFFDHTQPVKPSNAQPLFADILHQQVVKICPRQNDRSFSILFSNNRVLFFKVYGALSNVVCYNQEGHATGMFRNSMANDRQKKLQELPAEIEAEEGPELLFRVTGEQGGPVELSYQTDKTKEGVLFETGDILLALNECNKRQLAYLDRSNAKKQLLQNARSEYKKATRALEQTLEGIEAIRAERSPEELGRLLLSNLHAIQPGSDQVVVFDWYHQNDITIKLDKHLTPVQNAEKYFQKARNRKPELANLQQKAEAFRKKKEQIQLQIEEIEKADQLKKLKPLLNQKKAAEQGNPYYLFERCGFQVWVGKNAAGNDILTSKLAHKQDLWLHASGVSGSHVVVKHKPGINFDQQIIEQAAELAAWYSKARGSKWVPVSYTLKKFVRKPKGANPGQVVIEKESSILVQPILR